MSPCFIRYMRLLKLLHCLPVRYRIIFKIFKFIAYSDEKGCLASIISSFCPYSQYQILGQVLLPV